MLWTGKSLTGRPSGLKQTQTWATRFLILALSYALASKGVEVIWLRSQPRWSDYGFGLFLIVVGVAIIYGALRLALSLNGTGQQEDYALTDKRALICRTLLHQMSITSIPIQPNDWLTGDFGPLGRIIISRSQVHRNADGEPAFDETIEVFKDIADAAVVFDLIRKIQTGATTTHDPTPGGK